VIEDWSLDATPHGLDAVRFRGERVATRVFFSVRDQLWGSPTIRLRYSGAPTDAGGLTIDGSVDDYPLELHGSVRVHDDELRIAFDVLATADVEVTRAGPCILSDPRDLDPGFVASGPDGKRDVARADRILLERIATRFDRLDLTLAGCRVTIELTGDLFEMEDQRNWGDATFKSYCPPLGDPQAFLLRAGERRRYGITFTAVPTESRDRPHAPSTGSSVRELVTGDAVPMPGLGLRHSGGELSDDTLAVLTRIRPDYLHLLADLGSPHWRDELDADLRAAEQLGSDAVITVDAPGDGDPLRNLARLADGRAGTVLLFDRGTSTTSDELAATKAFEGTGIRVGGGTRSSFASLNAVGRVPDALRVIAVPLAVASHNDDLRAIASSIDSFAAIVRDSRRIAGDRELLVGPVSFRPTFDSWGPADRVHDPRGDWTSTSRRDGTAFAAAWTVAAVAALAECAVPRVTIGSTRFVGGPSTSSGTRTGSGTGTGSGTEPGAALLALSALRGRTVRRVDGGDGVVGLHSEAELVLGILTDGARIDYRGRVLTLVGPRVFSDSLDSPSIA
jgi:hypothetical protein